VFGITLPALGSAILFNLGASGGGTDIIAMIIKKYSSFNIGSALFVVDLCIMACTCFVFDITTGLFSFTGLMVKSLIIDGVIERLRPDYVIHGDNWREGVESAIRDNVLAALKKFGGELLEVSYTRSEETRKIDRSLKERLAMPEYRRRRLRQLVKLCPIVKALEVHSGLTGLIAEKTVVEREGKLDQFDAMWVSSLCDSTAKGKPDIELVDMSSRLRTIDDVMEVTTKPIILDGDTGGLTEHFVYNVRTLERMGVSAVIIEDKTGLKKNSLFGTEV
jgi:phosphoenolpyruvate phosphomutase